MSAYLKLRGRSNSSLRGTVVFSVFTLIAEGFCFFYRIDDYKRSVLSKDIRRWFSVFYRINLGYIFMLIIIYKNDLCGQS